MRDTSEIMLFQNRKHFPVGKSVKPMSTSYTQYVLLWVNICMVAVTYVLCTSLYMQLVLLCRENIMLETAFIPVYCDKNFRTCAAQSYSYSDISSAFFTVAYFSVRIATFTTAYMYCLMAVVVPSPPGFWW